MGMPPCFDAGISRDDLAGHHEACILTARFKAVYYKMSANAPKEYLDG